MICPLVKCRIVCTAHGSTCQEVDAVRSDSVYTWTELGTDIMTTYSIFAESPVSGRMRSTQVEKISRDWKPFRYFSVICCCRED